MLLWRLTKISKLLSLLEVLRKERNEVQSEFYKSRRLATYLHKQRLINELAGVNRHGWEDETKEWSIYKSSTNKYDFSSSFILLRQYTKLMFLQNKRESKNQRGTRKIHSRGIRKKNKHSSNEEKGSHERGRNVHWWLLFFWFFWTFSMT